jgi:hypothetical protein
MSGVDLQLFCGDQPARPAIRQPFSQGDFTYATNGHIAVRVPRLAAVPDHPSAPTMERLWVRPAQVKAHAVMAAALPEPTFLKCEECEGRGREHTCPDCTCVCEWCNGEGREEQTKWVLIVGRAVSTQTARLLSTLPNLRASEITNLDPRLWFEFDGGTGIVMTKGTGGAFDFVADLTPEASHG